MKNGRNSKIKYLNEQTLNKEQYEAQQRYNDLVRKHNKRIAEEIRHRRETRAFKAKALVVVLSIFASIGALLLSLNPAMVYFDYDPMYVIAFLAITGWLFSAFIIGVGMFIFEVIDNKDYNTKY